MSSGQAACDEDDERKERIMAAIQKFEHTRWWFDQAIILSRDTTTFRMTERERHSMTKIYNAFTGAIADSVDAEDAPAWWVNGYTRGIVHDLVQFDAKKKGPPNAG